MEMVVGSRVKPGEFHSCLQTLLLTGDTRPRSLVHIQMRENKEELTAGAGLAPATPVDMLAASVARFWDILVTVYC